jgi:hypothetical protein
VTLSTSVVTVTVGAFPEFDVAEGPTCSIGTPGTLGAPATLGTEPLPLPGTWAVAATVGAGAWAALFSLPHSIHSRVATISQAIIRKTRVWFMGDRQAQPEHASGVDGGMRAAGIVPAGADAGNAPARRNRPCSASPSSAPERRAASGRATMT